MSKSEEEIRQSRKFWSKVSQGNIPPGTDGGRWNEPRNREQLSDEDIYKISEEREKAFLEKRKVTKNENRMATGAETAAKGQVASLENPI